MKMTCFRDEFDCRPGFPNVPRDASAQPTHNEGLSVASAVDFAMLWVISITHSTLNNALNILKLCNVKEEKTEI